VPIAMKGHIVSGLGAAARVIHLQKPLLRDFLPDIENCKIGTINVQLDHALDIRIPDIVTPPLVWEPSSSIGERFGFTSVTLELFEKQHEAWIYGAEFSSHRFNYTVVELLARPITGVATARRKPLKPFAQGRPERTAHLWWTYSRAFYFSHAELRVHWAPGFPCALSVQGERS
jgi:hypothetical protein